MKFYEIYQFCHTLRAVKIQPGSLQESFRLLVLTWLINNIFCEVVYKHVFSYFHDISFYTTGAFEECLVHL